jgi:hypothetical protein
LKCRSKVHDRVGELEVVALGEDVGGDEDARWLLAGAAGVQVGLGGTIGVEERGDPSALAGGHGAVGERDRPDALGEWRLGQAPV